jgi:hypothetical protein
VLGQTHSDVYDFAERILSLSVGGSAIETFSHGADGTTIARTAAQSRPPAPNSISYIQGHPILGMIQVAPIYRYLSDVLRLVVDGLGAVVATYACDEFGNQTTGSADLRQHTLYRRAWREK